MQLTLDSSGLSHDGPGRDLGPGSVPVAGNDPETAQNDSASHLSLYEYEVLRDPRAQPGTTFPQAAHQLARQRRAVRWLWGALGVSLLAHLVIPAFLVATLTRPEKVALLDGTESLVIAPLVPAEESREVIETVSYWAAKSFLDRGPQGFDAPDTLERVFLPEAAKKAKAEFANVAEESSKKNIHQKLEIARIDWQRLGDGLLLSRVVGQLLTQAQIGDEQVNQPQPVTLNLKLARNPFLGRNKRYPYAVVDYNFGPPEVLNVIKRDEK
ncbi:MAG TPA: hypothetical protein VGD78_10080 [Chthoniobacterales bacterium]